MLEINWKNKPLVQMLSMVLGLFNFVYFILLVYLIAELKHITVHLKYQLSISVVSQISLKWNAFLIHSMLDHTTHAGCLKCRFYFALSYAQMVIYLLWGELMK